MEVHFSLVNLRASGNEILRVYLILSTSFSNFQSLNLLSCGPEQFRHFGSASHSKFGVWAGSLHRPHMILFVQLDSL